MFALHDTVFKAVALKDSFISSIFWQYAGLTLTGIVAFAFVPVYRNQFKNIFNVNGSLVLSLNVSSEVLYILGNVANNFATLLAPVALVLVVTSYQPLLGKDSVKINVDSTGYGLFTVKLIVDAHHGRVWVESDGTEKGTTFYIEFDTTG